MNETSATRRGTAVAGKIPVLSMPSGPAATRARLVRGTIPRKTDMRVPIRVQQSGGEPIHSAPTRRRDPRARPPPKSGGTPALGGVAAATPASRPFVLASLRALRLDPGAPSPAHSACTTKPLAARSRPKTRFALIIDKPFHNSLAGTRGHLPDSPAWLLCVVHSSGPGSAPSARELLRSASAASVAG